MEHEEILESIAQIQRIALKIRENTDIPTLERAMRTIETYCHMMQWQLGGTHEILPELELMDTGC